MIDTKNSSGRTPLQSTKVIKQDFSMATEYYLKSEALGNIKASFQIGFINEYGDQKDFKKALKKRIL